MPSAADTIEAGRRAGEQWAKQPMRQRRAALLRLGSVLAAHQDDLVAAIVNDTGKPALDALGGDVLVTLEHLRFYHRHAHKALATRRVEADWILFRSTTFTELREPFGVVLVYGASNYPLQLGMVPAITALYAGNAVVLKMSEQAPGLAGLLKRLIREAGIPEELLQIVSDGPETAGDYIDARPDFICFTGSSANGARVAERASRLLIPVLLELGGKDPAIVFGDCDLERSVEGVLYGAFSNSGQVCVGIKRLYVEETIYQTFIDRLTARVAQLRIGQNDSKDRDIAAISSPRLLERLNVQINDALSRGAKPLSSGSMNGAEPVVLAGVPREAMLLREETFGPVLCVAPFNGEAQAIAMANDTDFALGASIWTKDSQRAHRVATQLRAANISVNDAIRNIANPAASFGGNYASGYGRYHGIDGLFTFSRTKTIMQSTATSARQRNWFPFSAATYTQLRKLIDLRYRILARFGLVALVALQTHTATSHLRSLRGQHPVQRSAPGEQKA